VFGLEQLKTEEVGKRPGSREATETPEFIGLKEFSVKRRRLYHTAICNLDRGEVMEAVERQGSSHGQARALPSGSPDVPAPSEDSNG